MQECLDYLNCFQNLKFPLNNSLKAKLNKTFKYSYIYYGLQ